MPTDLIYLVGAGGHLLVVLDAALSAGTPPHLIRVVDENPQCHGKTLLAHAVTALTVSEISGCGYHVCVGRNDVRRSLDQRLRAAGGRPRTIVHPRASISRFAEVGEGNFIGANSMVAPRASIAEGVIINHGAIVDHECVVGSFAHVAPGASLAGGVKIAEEVLIGAGARVLPGLTVGAKATIGAGAVIIHDVPGGSVYVGVPGRRMR